MTGDKVSVQAQIIEDDVVSEYKVDVSEKPKFMLDEEYNQKLLMCAIMAVQSVCKNVAKTDDQRSLYLNYIINSVRCGFEDNTTPKE